MTTRGPRSPVEGWPWWKVTGIAVLSFGSLATILAVFPRSSPTAVAAGVIVAAAGVASMIRSWKSYSWWSRLGTLQAYPLLLYLIAARAWADILPETLLWIAAFSVAYLLALALPVIDFRLSAFVAREQTDPQTRLGRGCLALALILAPLAAGIGGTFGIYGTRLGRGDTVLLVVAVGLSAIGLAFAHSVSHTLWRDRRISGLTRAG